MRKFLALSAFLMIATGVFAQKADVKNDQIIFEGKAIAQIEKDGCGALSSSCNFYISSLSGEPLITVVALEMTDPQQVNSGNPEGKVRFLRFSFTGFDDVAEIRNPAMLNTRAKDVVQSIVKARLIQEDVLDKTAVENFIRANGTRFTDRQKSIRSIIIEDRR